MQLLFGHAASSAARVDGASFKPGYVVSSLAQSRVSHKEKETTMSKPTHRAHVVSTPKKEGDKVYWREVGTVWPHKNGSGFDVVIFEGISVSGRIVCTEPKDKDAAE